MKEMLVVLALLGIGATGGYLIRDRMLTVSVSEVHK